MKDDGNFIRYKVFDGMELIFAKFNSNEIFTPQAPANEIIEVSWCKRGRLECEFENDTVVYLQEGDFGINATSFIPVKFSFPIGIFETITLIIDKSSISANDRNITSFFLIDIDKLCNSMDLDKQWYICRSDKNIINFFETLYESKSIEDINYFKIKILELLYQLQYITEIHGCQIKYYTKNTIRKVKEIRDYLVLNLEEKKNIEGYVESKNIGITTFRKIFKQIYGDMPITYLKKYKMAVASKMIIEDNENITSIALNVGYANPSKFSKAFKEVYGILPKDYKRMIEEKGYFQNNIYGKE